MRALGIDPGTTRANPTGAALVSQERGAVVLHWARCLPVAGRDPLATLAAGLWALPLGALDAVVVEVPHVGANAQSALRLAEAVGVVAAFAARCGVPLIRCQPSQAKLALTGHGAADKAAMMAAARLEFGIDLPKDAADAVGVALHGLGVLHERRLRVLTRRPRKEP